MRHKLLILMIEIFSGNLHIMPWTCMWKIWDSQLKKHKKRIILIYRTLDLQSILRSLWEQEIWEAPVFRQPLINECNQPTYTGYPIFSPKALILIVGPMFCISICSSFNALLFGCLRFFFIKKWPFWNSSTQMYVTKSIIVLKWHLNKNPWTAVWWL